MRTRAQLALIAVGAAAVAAVGCDRRRLPYRFGAPLVAGERLPELGPQDEAPADEPRPQRPAQVASRPPPPTGRDAIRKAEALRVPDDEPTSTGPLGVLRATVGQRHPRTTALGFALRALAAISFSPQQLIDQHTPAAGLLELARKRGATSDSQPLLGDLLVLADGDVLGIVLSRRPDATVEFIYLGEGIVRRGFLNQRHPKRQRDDNGRVLNTLVRTGGTSHLAGTLFTTYIRIDRLGERLAHRLPR
jgi:hypothetical protein